MTDTPEIIQIIETTAPGVISIASVGPQGPQGPVGPQGPQGPKGDTAIASYAHTQNTTSNSWHIVHNLGFKPNVTVVDSAGTIVEGEITYTNLNEITISFITAFTGYAYLS
jgi:hypothetical protein